MTIMKAGCRPLIATIAVLGTLALTGCGGGAATGGPGDTVDIVSSFYPAEFLAKKIGGSQVSVTTLTEPGVEPHDLELSPRQTALLSEADLVVYLRELQPAVDEAIAQSGARTAVEISALTDGAADRHRGDPHLWLNPLRYAEAAQGVGAKLREVDPDHEDLYRKNTEALVERLRTLDRQFTDRLADSRGKTFITNHAAFGHLAQRYGLKEEAIAGIDPESEPSAARMRQLHQVAKRERVNTVFFETLASDKTARTLADDLGLRTDVLDPIEGITPTSRGDDYFAVMRANLTALHRALSPR